MIPLFAVKSQRVRRHVDGLGTALSQRVCDMDLEGIVAKQNPGLT